MPANVEFKARLQDAAAAHAVAARMSGGGGELISQTDVFFAASQCPNQPGPTLRWWLIESGTTRKSRKPTVACASPRK